MTAGHVGTSLLVQVLAAAASRHARSTGPAVELGTVQPDLSIRVDGWAVPIPAGEYLLPKRLLNGLESGDRVVCAWAGNDLIVLDVVVTS